MDSMSLVARLHRDAVDDPQRIVAGVDGGDTADADLGGGTRLAGVTGHLDTGHLTGEELVHGSDRRLGEAVVLKGTHRTGVGFAADSTVRNDDRFLKHLGVGLEVHVDDGAAVHGNLDGLETEAADDERTVGRDRNTVITESIRHGIDGRAALELHGCAGHDISGTFPHDAGHLHVLCEKCHAKQHK